MSLHKFDDKLSEIKRLCDHCDDQQPGELLVYNFKAALII